MAKEKKSKVGRKPLKDKAIPITAYIKESHVNSIGGKDKARTIAKEAIENTIPHPKKSKK